MHWKKYHEDKLKAGPTKPDTPVKLASAIDTIYTQNNLWSRADKTSATIKLIEEYTACIS